MAPEEPVGREDLEPGVGGRDEHDHHPGALGRPCLGARSATARLVAVVAVGDQELPVGERLGDALARQPARASCPRPRGRLAIGHGDGRVAVVEEEDRLELGARRAQQPQPALLRARVRALVREHGAGLVRLDAQRRDEAVAAPRDPVRADVVLLERPDGRLVVADEHALVEPGPEEPPGLVLGVVQGQVDDVVRVARAEAVALPPASITS